MPHGFLLIDKPAGLTSHDVVDKLRRITGVRRIGHSGTLDPFATGLLIIAIERQATRELHTFSNLDKVYEAEIVLGQSSTTLDPEGQIVDVPGHAITPDELESAMKKLTGPYEQIPPMHAAIKVGGKKLYELARQGIEVERKPRLVTIYDFRLITSSPHHLITPPESIRVRIHCSSGTYIRAMARDLGELLGTAGYVRELRRVSIGSYTVDEAKKLLELSPENWIDALRPAMVR